MTALCRENGFSVKQGGTAGIRLSLSEDRRFYFTSLRQFAETPDILDTKKERRVLYEEIQDNKTNEKKLMAITLIALMVITAMFTGHADSRAAHPDDGETFKIGLVRLMEHTSLDQIRESIIAELEAEGLCRRRKHNNRLSECTGRAVKP